MSTDTPKAPEPKPETKVEVMVVQFPDTVVGATVKVETFVVTDRLPPPPPPKGKPP